MAAGGGSVPTCQRRELVVARAHAREALILASVRGELGAALEQLDQLGGQLCALGCLPGEPKRAEADRSPVIRFYRASWEPSRGMVDVAFDVDLPFGLGDGGQSEGLA